VVDVPKLSAGKVQPVSLQKPVPVPQMDCRSCDLLMILQVACHMRSQH